MFNSHSGKEKRKPCFVGFTSFFGVNTVMTVSSYQSDGTEYRVGKRYSFSHRYIVFSHTYTYIHVIDITTRVKYT